MERHRFGPTKREVAVIGQGTWHFDRGNRVWAIAASRRLGWLGRIGSLVLGNRAAAIDQKLHVMAVECSDRLKSYGQTIVGATDYYIRHAEAARHRAQNTSQQKRD